MSVAQQPCRLLVVITVLIFALANSGCRVAAQLAVIPNVNASTYGALRLPCYTSGSNIIATSSVPLLRDYSRRLTLRDCAMGAASLQIQVNTNDFRVIITLINVTGSGGVWVSLPPTSSVGVVLLATDCNMASPFHLLGFIPSSNMFSWSNMKIAIVRCVLTSVSISNGLVVASIFGGSSTGHLSALTISVWNSSITASTTGNTALAASVGALGFSVAGPSMSQVTLTAEQSTFNITCGMNGVAGVVGIATFGPVGTAGAPFSVSDFAAMCIGCTVVMSLPGGHCAAAVAGVAQIDYSVAGPIVSTFVRLTLVISGGSTRMSQSTGYENVNFAAAAITVLNEAGAATIFLSKAMMCAQDTSISQTVVQGAHHALCAVGVSVYTRPAGSTTTLNGLALIAVNSDITLNNTGGGYHDTMAAVGVSSFNHNAADGGYDAYNRVTSQGSLSIAACKVVAQTISTSSAIVVAGISPMFSGALSSPSQFIAIDSTFSSSSPGSVSALCASAVSMTADSVVWNTNFACAVVGGSSPGATTGPAVGGLSGAAISNFPAAVNVAALSVPLNAQTLTLDRCSNPIMNATSLVARGASAQWEINWRIRTATRSGTKKSHSPSASVAATDTETTTATTTRTATRTGSRTRRTPTVSRSRTASRPQTRTNDTTPTWTAPNTPSHLLTLTVTRNRRDSITEHLTPTVRVVLVVKAGNDLTSIVGTGTVAATTAVSAFAAGAGLPTAAAQASKLASAVKLVACDYDPDSPIWSDFILRIDLVKDDIEGQWTGSAFLNAMITTGVACGTAATAWLTTRSERAVVSVPQQTIAVLAAMFLGFVGPNIMGAATGLIHHSDDAAVAGLMWVGMMVVIGSIAGLAATSYLNRPKNVEIRDRISSTRRRRFLIRSNELDDLEHPSIAVFIRGANRDLEVISRVFFFIDVSVAAITAGLSGIQPQGYWPCKILAVCAACVSAAYVAYLVWKRPLQDRIDFGFCFLMASTQVVICTFAVFGYETDDWSGSAFSWTVRFQTSLILLQSVTALGLGAVEMIREIIHNHTAPPAAASDFATFKLFAKATKSGETGLPPARLAVPLMLDGGLEHTGRRMPVRDPSVARPPSNPLAEL